MNLGAIQGRHRLQQSFIQARLNQRREQGFEISQLGIEIGKLGRKISELGHHGWRQMRMDDEDENDETKRNEKK